MSYEDMTELIYAAKPPVAQAFSNELLMSIFWEESFFNNVEQSGGTAWGFGQVEPAEMYRCENDDARRYGYFVQGLPPRNYVRNADGKVTSVRLMGRLTPEQSVKVTAGVLCSLQYTQHYGVEECLRGYAGVQYSGDDTPEHLKTAGQRLAVIAGWRACERALQGGWDGDFPTFVKNALYKSRQFELKDKRFDDALFPKNSVNSAGERIWLPQRAPGWLIDTMKG
jgi:hypothetical protein